MNREPKFRHICETCDREEIITSEQAYQDGWDYPPRMGVFGVVSPRTCPNCLMNTTVYWKLMFEHKKIDELSEHDLMVIKRIQAEPESLIPVETDGR